MTAKPFNFGSCQPDMLPDGNGGFYCLGGLSVRDWFAGMALQGWLASYDPSSIHPASSETANSLALSSYAMADAMLAAREGKEDSQ
jgi:hypothetical protein